MRGTRERHESGTWAAQNRNHHKNGTAEETHDTNSKVTCRSKLTIPTCPGDGDGKGINKATRKLPTCPPRILEESVPQRSWRSPALSNYCPNLLNRCSKAAAGTEICDMFGRAWRIWPELSKSSKICPDSISGARCRTAGSHLLQIGPNILIWKYFGDAWRQVLAQKGVKFQSWAKSWLQVVVQELVDNIEVRRGRYG